MTISNTEQEIRRLRQDYERGLLSVIVDQDRRQGFELLGSTVSQMTGLTAASGQWEQIHRWLLAQRSGQLALTSRSFGLLRDLGKVFKQLEGTVTFNAGGQVMADTLLAPVLTELTVDLASLEGAFTNEENWLGALRSLAEALDAWQLEAVTDAQPLEYVRRGFARVQDLAQMLSWDDGKEVSESLMNMLDRLLDGTLEPHQDHHSVSGAALALLETLSLPQTGSGEKSQIDDGAYERVIERADVLASGGSFDTIDLDAQEGGPTRSQTPINPRLATVLEAIPPLVADTLGQFDEAPVDEELRAELESLARIAHKLLHRLG